MAFLLAETVCNCLFPRLVGLLPRPCCCVLQAALSIRSTCSAPGYCCCWFSTLHEVLAH